MQLNQFVQCTLGLTSQVLVLLHAISCKRSPEREVLLCFCVARGLVRWLVPLNDIGCSGLSDCNSVDVHSQLWNSIRLLAQQFAFPENESPFWPSFFDAIQSRPYTGWDSKLYRDRYVDSSPALLVAQLRLQSTGNLRSTWGMSRSWILLPGVPNSGEIVTGIFCWTSLGISQW